MRAKTTRTPHESVTEESQTVAVLCPSCSRWLSQELWLQSELVVMVVVVVGRAGSESRPWSNTMTSPFYEVPYLNCHCSPEGYCTSCQQMINHSVRSHYSKTQDGPWGLVIRGLGRVVPGAGCCLIGSPSSTFPNNPCPTFEVLCLGCLSEGRGGRGEDAPW